MKRWMRVYLHTRVRRAIGGLDAAKEDRFKTIMEVRSAIMVNF